MAFYGDNDLKIPPRLSSAYEKAIVDIGKHKEDLLFKFLTFSIDKRKLIGLSSAVLYAVSKGLSTIIKSFSKTKSKLKGS